MKNVLYLRYKPTNQVCTLLATDMDGTHPAIANTEAFLSRFFVNEVISHASQIRLDDFELGWREEPDGLWLSKFKKKQIDES